MKKRWIGYAAGLLLAACLYFFENNTGTRIVLGACVLLPLIPFFRRCFFLPDGPKAEPSALPRLAAPSLPREEETPGDARAYRTGDPVNRIHWKLSAKRGTLLIRPAEKEKAEKAEEEKTVQPQPETKKKKPLKKRLTLCMLLLFALSLSLLLIPEIGRGAQALCNRLFDASERANAYVYDRFPVAADQPAGLAAAVLIAAGAALLGLILLSGSRLAALGAGAACALAQMYFGLSLPGWANVLLLTALLLWLMRKPRPRRDMLSIPAAVLLVALTVALLVPGVDAPTEAASERARDWISRAAAAFTGGVRETQAGEEETRHVHTQSLVTGDGEAATDRAYRLVTQEEQLLSLPEAARILEIVLGVLAMAAAVTLPFSPFLWLNARQKRARDTRAAFQSDDVSEAVCAIFQQVILWLTAAGGDGGNLPYPAWADRLPAALPKDYAGRFRQCAALFEEAAYSDHVLSEEQRRQALSLLDDTQRFFLARADWREKLRLKYRECLWE